MNTTLWIAVAIIVAVVVIALAAYFWVRSRRSANLRDRFGPEYDHAVEETGDRGKAESELREREKRVDKLDIRPLDADARRRFSDRWAEVQARFVDDPAGAVGRADALVGEVMSAMGYPVADFDERAADISVDHPHVVEQYRAGHAIAVRHSHGQASTEDMRQAMIHYRALFDELVNEGAPASHEAELTH